MSTKIKSKKSEKGQSLVIMIFVMVLALIIGVGISNRFITTLRTTTRSYTSYRADAVAQAAIERILLKSVSELEDYIAFGNCGADCSFQIVNDDGIVETATITLSYLGNSEDEYAVELLETSVVELSLSGFGDSNNLEVCWDGNALNPIPSVYASVIYGNQGNYQATNYAYNSAGSIETNGFSSASAANGYDSCFTVSSETDPRLLRIRSIYNDVDAVVIPSPGNTIPSQGVLIEAEGRVLDTTKSISVTKGNNSLPQTFDYVIYSKSETDPLSN